MKLNLINQPSNNQPSTPSLPLLLLVAFLITLFLLVPYVLLLKELPLYGDATIHGRIVTSILENGIFQTDTTYPPLYALLGALLYQFSPEFFIHILVLSGLGLISIGSFLILHRLKFNYAISLLAIPFVLSSPKIIFYSTRMYMEILLTGVFVITVYLLLNITTKPPFWKIVLLGLVTGIAASIKQQGLFILFPAIWAFLAIYKTKLTPAGIRSKLAQLSIFTLGFVIITIPAYLVLFKQVGQIVPSNQDYRIVQAINNFGQQLTNFTEPEDNGTTISGELAAEFEKINNDYYAITRVRSENRHIKPTDVFTNPKKSAAAHLLYVDHGSIQSPDYLINLNIVLFVISVILLLIKKPQDKSIRKYLLFLVIFLPINYIFFTRNTDQARYHLFIAVLLLPTIFYPIQYLFQKFKTQKHLKSNVLLILPIILIASLTFIYNNTTKYYSAKNTQIYTPSTGGINSFREAGQWFKNNTDKDDMFLLQSGNELEYYSSRDRRGDWQFYFLQDLSLDSALKLNNIDYLVLLQSHRIDDNRWSIKSQQPNSYWERVERMYTKVFISSTKDLYIYRVNRSP